jgi:PAS domain S-box-containing protein
MAEIVESAQEAIITFGDDGVITLFNEAAEGMFAVEEGDALDASIRDLFGDFDQVDLDRVCAETRSTPERRAGGRLPQRSLSLTGRRADGSTFPVEASMSCLELEAERVFTMIARDVSERKAAEEALRQQAVSLARTGEELQRVNHQLQARQLELEAAMSARSRFYASMSHELRTPINAIMGYSALLLDDIYGPLNPEQTRGIERANKAAKHLLELVNDILDLSKIEAGKLELEIQPATFPNVIQDLFVTVRPLADQHGSELALEHTGDPVTVITDPRRVRQILLNLLSNAIKFGEGKPITVHSRARDDGGMEVDVTDLGIGIPREDLEKIFDEFVQLSQANQHQGTGLGLPISRRLAVLLDGSLTVRSAPGEGSTFRLTLPAKVTEVGGVALIESGFPSANGAQSVGVAALPAIPDLPVATPIAPVTAPAPDASAEAAAPDAPSTEAPSVEAPSIGVPPGEAPSAEAPSTDAPEPGDAAAPPSSDGRRRKRDARPRGEAPAAETSDEEPAESPDPAAHAAG